MSLVAASDQVDPIVLDGRLVALAAGNRWRLLVDDLPDADHRLVALMCLCSQQVRAGRVRGPFTPELGKRWAIEFLERLDP